MEEKKLYLLAEYFYSISNSPNSPYPNLEINVVIEKDEKTNKFHYINFGIEYDNWREELIFETFEDAFDHFYDYRIDFFQFEIEKIDKNIRHYYAKKIIEKLNSDQINNFNKIPIKSFKEHLGIEIKLIENNIQKGFKKIYITKNPNSENEIKSFHVGKLVIEGTLITVKNEKDEIIFLTSSENMTISTEDILEDYYWYFTK